LDRQSALTKQKTMKALLLNELKPMAIVRRSIARTAMAAVLTLAPPVFALDGLGQIHDPSTVIPCDGSLSK
jgi:hypothetical protein